MLQDPATVVALAANHISKVSKRCSPYRAACKLANLADLDICVLAEAFVLTGLTKLGHVDFASLPNDLAVIQAIKSEDPIAQAFIAKECRRRPLGHVAAVLRCSCTWIRAAQEHWRLEMWDKNRPAVLPLPEEERMDEECTPRQIRDIITAAMKQHRSLTVDAAISIGVSQRWLMFHLKTKGMSRSDNRSSSLRLGNNLEAHPAEKAAIRERMNALGGVAEWAREVGLDYATARLQAKAVGYSRRRDDLGQASAVAQIGNWVKRTGYDGTTNAVGSAWLAKNVLCVDYSAFDRTRIHKVMRKLGFVSVRRTSSSDWVWVFQGKPVDRASRGFQYVDDERKASRVWDLNAHRREERAKLRAEILSGKVEPTPELLLKAGLRLK